MAEVTKKGSTASSAPTKVKLTLEDGTVYEYEGDLVNGKPHGKGKQTFEDGTVYIGDFANGKPHGKGKLCEVWEGDWVDGEFIPPFDKYSKTVYEGEFDEEGMPHGYGKMTYADGSVDEGYWDQGNFKGSGAK